MFFSRKSILRLALIALELCHFFFRVFTNTHTVVQNLLSISFLTPLITHVYNKNVKLDGHKVLATEGSPPLPIFFRQQITSIHRLPTGRTNPPHQSLLSFPSTKNDCGTVLLPTRRTRQTHHFHRTQKAEFSTGSLRA